MPAPPSTNRIEKRLDEITHILEKLDKRDQWRMRGAIVRSIIGLVPLLIFLYGTWYFFQHGGSLIENIIEQAARQAALISGQSSDVLMKQLEQSGILNSLKDFLP